MSTHLYEVGPQLGDVVRLTKRELFAVMLGQHETIHLTWLAKVVLAGPEPEPRDRLAHIRWEARADAAFRLIRADALIEAFGEEQMEE